MVFQTKRGSSPSRRRLGARSLVAVSLCVALASVGGASIATGAPIAQIAASPLKVAKKALRIARGANKRSIKALSVANQALSQSGQTGPKGDKGDKGDPGTSVTSAVEPAGANCADGGSAFTAANGVTYACNGADGADGAPGDPWTAGGTLPSGETETGTWATVITANGAGLVPIPFTLPLPAELDGNHVKLIQVGGVPPAECNDGVGGPPSAANPEADPGYLCVYGGSFGGLLGFIRKATELGTGGANTTGAVVIMGGDPDDFATGTWAVTAP